VLQAYRLNLLLWHVDTVLRSRSIVKGVPEFFCGFALFY
jgi:hypothetical protein